MERYEEQPSFCRECGIDRGYNHAQIRSLRYKLEYSELQNSKLMAECKRLRKDLRESKFRERSRSADRQRLQA